MRLRVRTAQTSLLWGVLILTAAVVGGSAYFSARFAVEDLAGQLMDASGERIEQQVQSVLAVAAAQGATDQQLLESGTFDLHDHEAISRYFLAAISARPSLSYISLGTERGTYWEVHRNAANEISSQRLLPNDQGGRDLIKLRVTERGDFEEVSRDVNTARPNPTTRPYYKAAVAAGVPSWPATYIFLGSAGTPDIPGLTRAIPIRGDGGRVVAVATADFDLLALSRYLAQLRVGERGLAFLLEERSNGQRRVIAHPDTPERLELTEPNPDGGRDALPASRVADDRVKQLLTHLGAVGSAPPTGQLELEVAGGERWLASVQRIRGEDRPPWLVVTLIPRSEVLGRVDEMNRNTLLVAIGGALLVLLLSLWIARRIGRALRRIADETVQIADFQLEPQPAVRSRITEVDRLGVAMEEMKSGLRSFQKYVPSELVRSILASGQEASLGASKRRISLYFSDIANFTRISEQLDADVLVEMLATYLGVMTRAMLNAGATVDKYIGDAIMAFWGAPHDVPDPALRACETALINQRELAILRDRWVGEGLPEISARIGLHTGVALVGNFGSENRLDYTAIGDSVNLASRLEGLNKQYGTHILLSDAMAAECGDRIATRMIDRVAVKGRGGGTLIHELLGMAGQVDATTLELARAYEAALAIYFEGRFDEAATALDQLLTRWPEDGPAAVLRDRCRAYVDTPPEEPWTGVFVATLK